MPVPQMQHEGHKTRFGPFAFDARTEELWKNGLKLKLQGQPLKVLAILLEKPGELVTREEIRQRLWPADTFVDFEHSLNTDIKRLREVLGDEAETPRYIETLRGKGYRFVAPTQFSEVSSAPCPIPINSASSGHKRRDYRSLLAIRTLALISLLGGITYWISKPPPAPRIVASHQITRDGLEKTRPVSDGARLYFNEVTGRSMMLAQVSVAGGEVSQVATPFVGDPVPYDLSPDKSEILLGEGLLIGGVFPVWVVPLPSGPARRLPFETSSWATWTQDGKEILFARKNELFLGAKDGAHPRRLLTATGDISRPQISPDAQRIRFGVAGGPGEPASSIWEASIDGSDPHRLFPSHNEPHYSGTWSSDGNHYFFSSRMGPLSNLWVLPEKRPWWKRSSPAPVRLTFGPLSLGREAVTRDNAKLFALAIDARGELSILDEKSKQFVPYLSGVSACEVAFSSDGQWVAYVAYPEGTLWRSRIDGSERMQLTFSPMGIVNPRWSPDGKLIVFTEITRGKMAIYVVPAVGGAPMLTIAGEFSVHEPMWSRDGRSIVYGVCPICEPKAQPALWIYDLKTQQSTKVPGSDGLWSPRWSPDGRYLTAMTIDVQHLMLFRFSTRKWETLGSGFELGWPAWSHDSNYVYIEQHPSRIVRFKVSDHTVEPVTTLEHIRPAVYPYASGGGYTLTPDDRVLLMREIGTWDVYAFDLAFD